MSNKYKHYYVLTSRCDWKLWKVPWFCCVFLRIFIHYYWPSIVSSTNCHRLCVWLMCKFWYSIVPNVVAVCRRLSDFILLKPYLWPIFWSKNQFHLICRSQVIDYFIYDHLSQMIWNDLMLLCTMYMFETLDVRTLSNFYKLE